MNLYKENLSVSGTGLVIGMLNGISIKKTKTRTPNNYWYDVESGEVHVELTKGYWCTVDMKDWSYLKYFSWYALVSTGTNNTCYAATSVRGSDGKYRIIMMHKMIMESPDGNKGLIIDHFDTDSLNNKRNNLKVTTRSNNILNAKVTKRNTSGEKNIGMYGRRTKLFNVSFRVLGKPYIWRGFKTLESAIEFRNKISTQIRGDYFKAKKGGF